MLGCTPKCNFTAYALKSLSSGSFDSLKFEENKTDGANIAVLIQLILSVFCPFFAKLPS